MPFQSLLHQGNTSNENLTMAHDAAAEGIAFQSLLHQGNTSNEKILRAVATAQLGFQSLLHQGNTSNRCFSKWAWYKRL